MINKINLPQNANILDIGCGTGINLKTFFTSYNYYGIDLNEEAVKYCRKRNLKNIYQQDINTMNFPDTQFDLITAFGVLYHENIDMKKTLNHIYDHLKPGGYLIITDPAFNFIMSEHDVVMGVQERFTKATLESYLKASRLNPIYSSYGFAFLFPILVTSRLIKKYTLKFKKSSNKDLKSDVYPMAPIINNILIFINKFEAKLQTKFKMPFGSTILSISQK